MGDGGWAAPPGESEAAVRVRPAMTPDEAAVYDWFAENGVDEWLPPVELWQPLQIGSRGELTYTAHTWEGPRGWDPNNVVQVDGEHGLGLEQRTVPLVVPLTDHVRRILTDLGVSVVDESGR